MAEPTTGNDTERRISRLEERRAHKARVTRTVLVIEFLLNVLVALGKLIVGIATNSISMIADGYHSLLDGASNIIGFVGMTAASRPPDSNHPYGHGKFETLASMGIGVMLFGAAYKVVAETIDRVATETVPTVTALSFGVMIGTMIINGCVSFVQWRIGRRIGSQILLSDAAHTRSDVFVSLSVIVSLGAVKMGIPWADPVIAVLIAGFICYTGYRILHDGIMDVSDVAAIPPEEIRRICLESRHVEAVEQIRSRSHSDQVFLDLILVVEPDLTVKESHEIVDEVEERIIERHPEVRDIVIHVEPPGLEQRSPGRPEISASGRQGPASGGAPPV